MLAAWWNPVDWIRGAIGWFGEQITDAASGLLGQVFEWVAGALIRGIVWLFDVVLGYVYAATTPDVEASWFTGADAPGSAPLEIAKSVGGFLLVLFVILAIAEAVWNRDGNQLLRSTAQDLPRAVFLIVTLTFATTLAVAVADAFAAQSMDLFGTNIEAIPNRLAEITHGLVFGVGVLVVALVALFLALTLLFVAFELLIRQALIYVLVVVATVLLTTEVYRPTKGMGSRALRLLGVTIAAKPMIALCLAVAATAVGSEAAGVTDAGSSRDAVEEPGRPAGTVSELDLNAWMLLQRQQSPPIPPEYLIEENCAPITMPGGATSCQSLQLVDGVVMRADGIAAITRDQATASDEPIDEQETTAVAPTVGLLLAGLAAMVLAAFSPFLLLRLINTDPAGDLQAWRRGVTAPIQSAVTKGASLGAAGGGGGGGGGGGAAVAGGGGAGRGAAVGSGAGGAAVAAGAAARKAGE
jgi:hypothetical protein